MPIKPREWEPWEKQLAIKCCKEGQGLGQIANRLNRSKSSISGYLASVGLKSPDQPYYTSVPKGPREEWGYVNSHARNPHKVYGVNYYGGPTRDQAIEIIADGRIKWSAAGRWAA